MKAYMKLDSGTVIETDNPENWKEAKRLPAKSGKQIMADEARRKLRWMLKPGDTVYTVLRHVSSSGMSRRIDCYKMSVKGPIYLTGYIAKVCGYNQHDHGPLIVGGCGMDMGFEVVYNLGREIFPKGFIPAKHGGYGRNGSLATERDNDGGYALKQKWL